MAAILRATLLPVSDAGAVSPKDRFITVYGRKPVLEALADPDLEVDKVVLADTVRGGGEREITAAARGRGVPVQRATAQRVKVLAGNGRHDQGVLADVVAPRMSPLEHFLSDLGTRRPASVLVLDAVTNPSNVGMILRSATAAGLDGVLLPRRGVPAIDPLVIKASAGVAFAAPVLRCATATEGVDLMHAAGFGVFGLDAGGDSLLEASLPPRVALVLGNETDGLTEDVRSRLDGILSLPMYGGVESLNVASAGAVAAYELLRRR
ncbi:MULTISPECIES: TrmH family RNA methyltransferase [Pseudonocardia]|jgi:23S rRNA (guanosine2251-2'-O)-methyltransferase|uniref:TrmH family RNA methyltransferase n=1 Tax=Pseudonocardia TaxID=1847 RepID=UPI0006CB063D|nr:MULTISPECIES: RNA methyltransferase [Pseudonocardia]ALE78929.1 RNA methyltransferase [Pseudonocardia sp. AL041005-10]MBO4239853.1 RNA methyltransferase [Pseudonocardia alni]MCM3846712.1 RNA methyltransferase [Pseudonocardia sp. DR1-2]WFG44730.1 RNA methyltransferase [Pseudonocardia alni]